MCVYCDCRFPFQLKAKRSECNFKATHTRNEYMLTLVAANAHQRHYYDTDLINCIKVRMGTRRREEDIWRELKQVCFFVGARWSDLQSGEGLSEVTLSD